MSRDILFNNFRLKIWRMNMYEERTECIVFLVQLQSSDWFVCHYH